MKANQTIPRFLNKSNWCMPGAEFNSTPCLVWRGTTNNGRPSFEIHTPSTKRRIFTTPREFAYALAHNRRAERPIDMLCGDSDCCRPSHMQQRSRS